MRIQGKRLSEQARTKLNSVLLDWMVKHKDEIDSCCLIAELFGKARWRAPVLTRLRAQMSSLLMGLRVRYRDTPKVCVIETLDDVRGRATQDEEWWERVSTPTRGAYAGVDHTAILKKDKIVRAERL